MSTWYADAKYYALKWEARNRVVVPLNKNCRDPATHAMLSGLVFSPIGEEAVRFAELQWPMHYSESKFIGLGKGWKDLLIKYKMRPSFFDVAIWQTVDGRKILQGLALGKPSNGKGQLNLNVIERYLGPEYIRIGVLLPILACAEEYAKLLGCRFLVVKNLIDESALHIYGFAPTKLPGGETHLAKELSHD